VKATLPGDSHGSQKEGKKSTGGRAQDRARVAGGQKYEVA
jgi:hypothetical protein